MSARCWGWARFLAWVSRGAEALALHFFVLLLLLGFAEFLGVDLSLLVFFVLTFKLVLLSVLIFIWAWVRVLLVGVRFCDASNRFFAWTRAWARICAWAWARTPATAAAATR